MTTTLTDQDREIVRWFAEECLGYDWHIRPGTGCAMYHGDAKHDEWWEMLEDYDNTVCECDLTGWPGFGRVVEYAFSQGVLLRCSQQPSGLYYAEEWRNTGIGREHPDPAIAAMLALRQAVGQVVT